MKKIILTLCFCLAATALMAQSATLPANVTLHNLKGEPVQASAITNDGNPIIISFWATWCKPCNRELTNIKEVYDQWQEETGVKLVAISIDDARSVGRVRPHVEGNDWPYEVYTDQNSDLKRALGIVNVPHTILLNGDGEIVWQHTGYQDGSEDELYEKVKKLATKQ